MTDRCSAPAGVQVSPCTFTGGSTLGWGPVGPAGLSAKSLVDGASEAPTSWAGPILMAGWEFFNPQGLAQCQESLAGKYPPGWAFDGVHDVTTNLGGQVLADAEVMYDLNKTACALLDEWSCRTARWTLPHWWADYGLPDDCGIDNLCAKVAAIGGADNGYLMGLADRLGHEITCADVPPEIQAGCWELGIEPMPPDPEPTGGGCDLGFLALGECIDLGGSPLGRATLGSGSCNRAGFSVRLTPSRPYASCGVVAYDVDADGAVVAYGDAATCVGWSPPAAGTLVCGCRAPWSLDEYVGTAHHMIVGSPQPMGVASAVIAITGSWSMGCASLCTPEGPEIICVITRYRPAHVVPVPVFF